MQLTTQPPPRSPAPAVDPGAVRVRAVLFADTDVEPEPPHPPRPEYTPGSHADFHRLYTDSYPRILFTLLGILRDRHAAEDCAQETFVRAYRAWPRWSPDAPAEAWLHRIALNVATSHRRRERLRTVGELVRRIGHPGALEHPSATGGDTADTLLAAMRRMPAEQAATIVLRHHHGYTNREIARALGVPESTVASRLAAAKRRLRQELGEAAPANGADASPDGPEAPPPAHS